MTASLVVVGASLGGVRTAQALRRESYPGRIVLVGAEPHLPYDRPPLSKQYLAGRWTAERVSLLSAADAVDADIELRLGVAAEHLDLDRRQVVLADGERIGYDVVVLATGSCARPSPWAAPSGIHTLRTIDDSTALAADLAVDGPVVVIGAGFIGSEVTATARALGREVTIVDPLEAPLGRALGAQVGSLLADLHRRHGVATCFGTGVQSVVGRSGDLTVLLSDGKRLAAATVVVGIGACPNDAWLASSGLRIDDGVVCDEFCRAVGAQEVFAVGDVARWLHLGYGERCRVEHWTNAVDQAGHVARTIARPDHQRAYRPTEYVWTDQFDWRIQVVGRPARASGHHLVGTLGADSARAAVLYAEAGRFCAATVVNWPKALVGCRRLLADGTSIDDAVRRIEDLAGAPGRPSPRGS